jgi:hypothetical protein
MKKLIALFAIVVLSTVFTFAAAPANGNATVNLICPLTQTTSPLLQTIPLTAGQSANGSFVWSFQYRGNNTLSISGGDVTMNGNSMNVTYPTTTGTGTLAGWSVSVTWTHDAGIQAGNTWGWDTQTTNCDITGSVTEAYTITSPIGASAGEYDFVFMVSITE